MNADLDPQLCPHSVCLFFRFYSHFPDLVDKAIDAMLDLCEDPVVDIRKQAIRDLPTLCRDNKANLPKITDVLTQVELCGFKPLLSGRTGSRIFRRQNNNLLTIVLKTGIKLC